MQQNFQNANSALESLVKQSSEADKESEKFLKELQEQMNQPRDPVSLPSLDTQTLFYFNEAQRALQNLSPAQRLLNRSQATSPIPPATSKSNRLRPYRMNPQRRRSPASGTFREALPKRRPFSR